ncbi:hypothetical protein [Falsiruegeria litorea]|uniref:hypothetical protein n=1 Tax=Falsiruegeria litorea TaxID=1280831 RepID=UPI001BFD7582|nr:hypothetical protein [Falsiruegeria litorea]MBT8167629.1 hypothetical protein [Falsiruegeria litorea]
MHPYASTDEALTDVLCLTGMVFGECREIVALDIDVEDPHLSNQINAHGHDLGLESPFVRIGNAPKFMAFFRGRVRSQRLNGVDIFGSSGQVAIYGTHPTTRCAYEWPYHSLMDVRPEDLPEITQDVVDEWVDRISPLLGERANSGGGGVIPAWVKEFLKKDGIDGAHRLIVGLTDGNRHPTLLGVTAWLVSEGYEPEDVADFINNNFPEHLRLNDWRNVRPRVLQMAEDACQKFFGEEKW